jgi:hypothetical protein
MSVLYSSRSLSARLTATSIVQVRHSQITNNRLHIQFGNQSQPQSQRVKFSPKKRDVIYERPLNGSYQRANIWLFVYFQLNLYSIESEQTA